MPLNDASQRATALVGVALERGTFTICDATTGLLRPTTNLEVGDGYVLRDYQPGDYANYVEIEDGMPVVIKASTPIAKGQDVEAGLNGTVAAGGGGIVIGKSDGNYVAGDSVQFVFRRPSGTGGGGGTAEIQVSTVDLSGPAGAGLKWGINNITGSTFYVSGGNWTPSPGVVDEVLLNAGPLSGAAAEKVGVNTTNGNFYYESGGVWVIDPVYAEVSALRTTFGTAIGATNLGNLNDPLIDNGTVVQVFNGLATNVSNLVTLTGVALDSTDLGIFTGSTIPDNSDIKVALASLETAFEGLSGGFNFLGGWNASTNTPTITSGVGNNGDLYAVTVAGNTVIDGQSDWQVGDRLFFDGVQWNKIDNTDSPEIAALRSLSGTSTGATDYGVFGSSGPLLDTSTNKQLHSQMDAWAESVVSLTGVPIGSVNFGTGFTNLTDNQDAKELFLEIDSLISGEGITTVQEEGVALPLQPAINFIGAAVTAADDPTNSRTNITITGAGHVIQDEGVNLTNRTNLNFIGTAVTASDNLANDATDVTIGGNTSFITRVDTVVGVEPTVGEVPNPVERDVAIIELANGTRESWLYTGGSWSRQQVEGGRAFQTLVAGATVDYNVEQGTNARYDPTLASQTIADLSGSADFLKDGISGNLVIRGNSNTVVFSGNWDFPGGTPPGIPTSNTRALLISWVWDATAAKIRATYQAEFTW